MATRNGSPRTRKPERCQTCKGTGEVEITVRVGRRHRSAGQQSAVCLDCLGTGDAITPA